MGAMTICKINYEIRGVHPIEKCISRLGSDLLQICSDCFLKINSASMDENYGDSA